MIAILDYFFMIFMMSELEKLKAGLDYCFADKEVKSIKDHAVFFCFEYNNIHPLDRQKRISHLKKLLGNIFYGKEPKTTTSHLISKLYFVLIIFSI